jgi:hypothetical protein
VNRREFLASAALFVAAERGQPRRLHGGDRTLEPRDFRSQARLAIMGYMVKALDWNSPSRLPLPYFRSWVLPPKLGHDRWDFGDCTARAVLAWPLLRKMTDDHVTGAVTEAKQRQLLLSLLRPDTGLAFVPPLSAPTSGKYHYHLWDQGRTLLALAELHSQSPSDRTLKMHISRIVNGLSQFASLNGVDSHWGKWRGFPSDEFENTQPGPMIGWINMRSGLCIEGMARFARDLGDSKALQLAKEFANCALGGHEGDKTSDEMHRREELSNRPAKEDFAFGTDGSFTGHFHTKTATLIGITELSRVLAANSDTKRSMEYLKCVKKSYDWIFAYSNVNRGSKIGWFPEQIFPDRTRVVCEACCLADMIELAAGLAACFSISPELHELADLYDDVEAFSVNTLARSQLVISREYERFLNKVTTAGALQTARRLEGSWIAKFYPNDLVFREHDGTQQSLAWGCCAYSGFRGLYAAWRNSVLATTDGTLINYFINFEDENVLVRSKIPQIGSSSVRLRRGQRVLIRVPVYCRPDDVKITIGGTPAQRRLAFGARYLDLGRLPADTTLDVAFPLPEVENEEVVGGNNRGGNLREAGYCDPRDRVTYSIRWRGNYVIKMTPSGKIWPVFP